MKWLPLSCLAVLLLAGCGKKPGFDALLPLGADAAAAGPADSFPRIYPDPSLGRFPGPPPRMVSGAAPIPTLAEPHFGTSPVVMAPQATPPGLPTAPGAVVPATSPGSAPR